MLQVWSASHRPPSGETSANRNAVSAPKTALAVRAAVRCGSGRSLLGPAVIGASGISAAGGSGVSTSPVTILDNGGCSGR